ncbi:unnamed protein product [Protopolystoma xenopodis]|uniref:WW domain-containing protein n=1 Tax=Protopolystoma xenopodis TaxID=117903 RepID=A0A3S5A9Q8_9PLAT|nr:unnamed protein product [Protopolystoma xenopodis]
MPLPPALLARLKRRGIIQNEAKENVEEVFAENYDDTEPPKSDTTRIADHTAASGLRLSDPELAKNNVNAIPVFEDGYLVHECAECPNQQNPYHTCSVYCFDRYGRRQFKPDSSLQKRKERMLRRYPLPSHWIEVGDPVSHRFYYWNTKTDDVCWLSPLHPRAKITAPASIIKSKRLAERDRAAAAAGLASAAIRAAEVAEEISGGPSNNSIKKRSIAPTNIFTLNSIMDKTRFV